MANPNPSPSTRFQPGNPGPPKGHKRPSIMSAIRRQLAADPGLVEQLADVWIAAALGDKKRLKDREPDHRFLAMLLDRIDGKVGEPPQAGKIQVVRLKRRPEGGPPREQGEGED